VAPWPFYGYLTFNDRGARCPGEAPYNQGTEPDFFFSISVRLQSQNITFKKMMSTDSPSIKIPRLHPQFCSPLADVILVSTDDTGFRVPHFTLRNTCGHFRKLLSPGASSNSRIIRRELVVDDEQQEKQISTIHVEEADTPLVKFLSLICGLPTDGWESLEELENVLSLSQRWDAPGPISVIRSAITAPVFLAEALRLYDITSRMGWEEEASIASIRTLGLNLYDEEHRPDLERMTSCHLMKLFKLHRERRDKFKILIDSDELFTIGNSTSATCPGCGEQMNNGPWRELKVRMFLELDRRPLGDMLGSLDMEEWPEAIACWEAKCAKADCERLNYSRLATLRDINHCVSLLPSHV